MLGRLQKRAGTLEGKFETQEALHKELAMRQTRGILVATVALAMLIACTARAAGVDDVAERCNGRH